MQPYRLEMGTRFANTRGKDLYSFWGESLTNRVNELTATHNDRTLVNLASNEYFKAIRPKSLQGPLITPVFKRRSDGKSRVISFMAKRARGMMARYLIENQVEEPAGLKAFSLQATPFALKSLTTRPGSFQGHSQPQSANQTCECFRWYAVETTENMMHISSSVRSPHFTT